MATESIFEDLFRSAQHSAYHLEMRDAYGLDDDYREWTDIKAGEDVRWLPRRQASGLALPGNDFWLFDGTSVLFNHFAGDGEMTGEELVTAPATVELCASAFAAVWARATPHEGYRPV